ncbi:calcium-binding protein [Tateyamaria sp. ANG-S1]|uniref:calcium-binding protein n=1 Tax=Tateyamaria sp. ANG-S1 TaxID=1577905 RepID=UPI0005807612|nr:calcium-binding protein [Tateyamaria sp. ANG-S1]KIC48212.1 hypothetical protein RA29_16870 [Tateyamaria sp. ANG-S1]
MSENNTVTFVIENLGAASETLGEEHFGANMLFHADRTDEGSDFVNLIEDSGITSIRYPGGTIAEQFFDLSNPNQEFVSNYFDVRAGRPNIETREVLPLSDYLEFVHGIDGQVTIVLPTFRYFDDTTRTLSSNAEAEITQFVTALLNGEFGPVSDFNFELGNEWYQSNFDWTAAEFGHLQAEIARMVAEASEALGMRNRVDIFAQGDADPQDNAVLASYFGGTYSAYLDGVLAHIYGANSRGNTLGIGGAIQPRLDTMMQPWESLSEAELLLAITEWNVGESGEDSTLINGLMRSAPLLRMFAELVQSDIDMAHIWSVQTAGPAGLSGREGTGSDWSPTGYLYNMLIDGALGSTLVDTGASFRLRDETNAVVGYTYTFSQNGRTDIFFSSGVAYDVSVGVNLSDWLVGATHVYASVLTSAPGTTGTEHHATASLEFVTGLNQLLSLGSSSGLSFEIGSYETVQLTITYGTGIDLQADQQVAIPDTLTGSQLGDTIDGGMGSDTLMGLGGRDSLVGGSGDDFIFGGHHHDTILGGQGDDSIEGGDGRDSLQGGEGNDSIYGGTWNDSIWGGNGSDSLTGGLGNDHIFGEEGNDILFGGAGSDLLDGGVGSDYVFGDAGNDRIIIDRDDSLVNGGEGADTVSLATVEAGTTVWTRIGVFEIGIDQILFEEIEVIETTEHADRISLSGRVETVFSLGGSDTLQIWNSENVSVHLGNGDDTVLAYDGHQNLIYGDNGEDLFRIFHGSNTFFGGFGNDTFEILSPLGTVVGFNEGDGHDTVHHFNVGRDSLLLDAGLQTSFSVENMQGGSLIRFDDNNSISLMGVYGLDMNDVFDFF